MIDFNETWYINDATEVDLDAKIFKGRRTFRPRMNSSVMSATNTQVFKSALPHSQLYQHLVHKRHHLSGRHLQNIQPARIPFGLSCESVRPCLALHHD
jgi:hypothetical protein